MKARKEVDLIILGGGMAGLTAGIFAARARLDTVLLEQRACGGLANWTHCVENFPSYEFISGMDLMERVQEQASGLGLVIEEACEIEQIELDDELKRIETDETLYSAPAIILATGRDPLPLEIELDNESVNERIHYCSVCDGSAYIGKQVLVVGGGNSACDESLYLLDIGVAGITLVEAMDACCAQQATLQKLVSHPNVDVHTGCQVQKIEMVGDMCRVTLANRLSGQSTAVDVHGIFVFIGQRPNTANFPSNLALDPAGYILTGEDCETNLPGVFAAGDVIQKRYRYLTTAAADGTIAALAAEKYIRALKTAGQNITTIQQNCSD